MKTEYEATFWPIDKNIVRDKLQSVGAVLSVPERLMRRRTFNLPPGQSTPTRFARVRDEGNKITMSVKDIGGTKIDEQKESEVVVNDFAAGAELLLALGCVEKAYQETRRELWVLDGVEIMIDEWPYLEPLIEVEGPDEAAVRTVSEKLGFLWSEARFCAVGAIISEKYDVTEDFINNHVPRIVFDEPNPFQ